MTKSIIKKKMPTYLDILSSKSNGGDSVSSTSTIYFPLAKNQQQYQNNIIDDSSSQTEIPQQHVITAVDFDLGRGFLKHARDTWYDERTKTKLRPKNFARPYICFSEASCGNSRKRLYTCSCRDRYFSSRSRLWAARDECDKACKATVGV